MRPRACSRQLTQIGVNRPNITVRAWLRYDPASSPEVVRDRMSRGLTSPGWTCSDHSKMGRAAMRMQWLAILTLWVSAAGAETALDAIDAHKHMGVATCSNSVCHGASQPFRDSDVMQNEFAIWQEFDPHAKAYQILEKPESKAIAQKLGLGDPTQAKVCLDCHADNQPTARRGERFQISDGVGCEACHGGSELWLNAHSDRSVAHADNLGKGMYATENPIKRAQLCLSCHMGEKERMITHRIMGAGHPRLSFELDTFTWLHPHYKIGEKWTK